MADPEPTIVVNGKVVVNPEWAAAHGVQANTPAPSSPAAPNGPVQQSTNPDGSTKTPYVPGSSTSGTRNFDAENRAKNLGIGPPYFLDAANKDQAIAQLLSSGFVKLNESLFYDPVKNISYEYDPKTQTLKYDGTPYTGLTSQQRASLVQQVKSGQAGQPLSAPGTKTPSTQAPTTGSTYTPPNILTPDNGAYGAVLPRGASGVYPQELQRTYVNPLTAERNMRPSPLVQGQSLLLPDAYNPRTAFQENPITQGLSTNYDLGNGANDAILQPTGYQTAQLNAPIEDIRAGQNPGVGVGLQTNEILAGYGYKPSGDPAKDAALAANLYEQQQASGLSGQAAIDQFGAQYGDPSSVAGTGQGQYMTVDTIGGPQDIYVYDNGMGGYQTRGAARGADMTMRDPFAVVNLRTGNRIIGSEYGQPERLRYNNNRISIQPIGKPMSQLPDRTAMMNNPLRPQSIQRPAPRVVDPYAEAQRRIAMHPASQTAYAAGGATVDPKINPYATGNPGTYDTTPTVDATSPEVLPPPPPPDTSARGMTNSALAGAQYSQPAPVTPNPNVQNSTAQGVPITEPAGGYAGVGSAPEVAGSVKGPTGNYYQAVQYYQGSQEQRDADQAAAQRQYEATHNYINNPANGTAGSGTTPDNGGLPGSGGPGTGSGNPGGTSGGTLPATTIPYINPGTVPGTVGLTPATQAALDYARTQRNRDIEAQYFPQFGLPRPSEITVPTMPYGVDPGAGLYFNTPDYGTQVNDIMSQIAQLGPVGDVNQLQAQITAAEQAYYSATDDASRGAAYAQIQQLNYELSKARQAQQLQTQASTLSQGFGTQFQGPGSNNTGGLGPTPAPGISPMPGEPGGGPAQMAQPVSPLTPDIPTGEFQAVSKTAPMETAALLKLDHAINQYGTASPDAIRQLNEQIAGVVDPTTQQKLITLLQRVIARQNAGRASPSPLNISPMPSDPWAALASVKFGAAA